MRMLLVESSVPRVQGVLVVLVVHTEALVVVLVVLGEVARRCLATERTVGENWNFPLPLLMGNPLLPSLEHFPLKTSLLLLHVRRPERPLPPPATRTSGRWR